MILLHVLKMTLASRSGKQVQVNEDVTYYYTGTAVEAIRCLAELQRLKRELKDEHEDVEVFHLLHTSDIVVPWFEELKDDLVTLGGCDLSWQLQSVRTSLETKKSWYEKCQMS